MTGPTDVGDAPLMSPAVRLRPLGTGDAAVMADVLSGPSLYEFTGGEPPTVDQLEKRYAVLVRGSSPDGRQEWLNELVCLMPDGQPIGYVQATIPRDGGPTEVAWVIGEPWQGHGYATAAARLLVQALDDRGITELVAHIHPAHEASAAVARRIGMTPTSHVVDGEVRWELRLG